MSRIRSSHHLPHLRSNFESDKDTRNFMNAKFLEERAARLQELRIQQTRI